MQILEGYQIVRVLYAMNSIPYRIANSSVILGMGKKGTPLESFWMPLQNTVPGSATAEVEAERVWNLHTHFRRAPLSFFRLEPLVICLY